MESDSIDSSVLANIPFKSIWPSTRKHIYHIDVFYGIGELILKEAVIPLLIKMMFFIKTMSKLTVIRALLR